MKTRSIARLALAAVLLTAHAPAVQAITGAEVIDRMQKSFAKAKTFSAKFEKRFYWAVLDKRLSSKGRLYTRKPGQFRVEVGDGVVIVADGQAIWAYMPANDQVFVSAYDGDLPTPWEILVDYTESFAPRAVMETELDGRSCYLVTLEPRSERSVNAEGQGRVVRIKVWVGRKNWHLLKIEQFEANDDVRTYILEGHRTGKKLSDELFAFEPPEGVQVIDRRPAPSRLSERSRVGEALKLDGDAPLSSD